MKTPYLISPDYMDEATESILSVSKLNEAARKLIEAELTDIWVIGEISNLSQPASGHLYFSLKDEHAQVRCAFFRGYQRHLDFKLENGQQVLVQAQASIYEARGDFQLIVQRMQMAGAGALQLAFEKLKKQLSNAGLFDAAAKKSIPTIPRCIGVITSPTGAAIRDILQVLKRRCGSISVVIYPTSVQGNNAAAEIVAAIQLAQQRHECDVLLVARGGGSLEDLWPFNEKIVAEAMFACNIPIVTGIGHEIDFTIADFVADQRAATPSAAAEWISPEQSQLQQQLINAQKRLNQLMKTRLRESQLQLQHLRAQLKHPQQLLKKYQQELNHQNQRLMMAMDYLLDKTKQRLHTLSQALHTVSPLATLQRGYAIVTQQKSIITNVHQLKPGKQIKVQFCDGNAMAEISKINHK